MGEGRDPSQAAPPLLAAVPAALLASRLARILRATDLPAAVEAILDEAQLLLSEPRFLLLHLRTNDDLVLQGSRGVDRQIALLRGHVPIDAPSLIAEVATTGDPAVRTVHELDPAYAWSRDLAEQTGTESLLVLPLRSPERVVAVLTCGKEEGGFESEEVAALIAVGELFAMALAGTLLRHEGTYIPRQPVESGLGTELERIRDEMDRCHKVEAELRVSEERFRKILEEAPTGMAVVSLAGRYQRVNRVLCEVVGYTPDELLELRFQDITHPDDLATDLAYVDALVRGEIPRYQMEKRYIRKDGSEVLVQLSVSLVRDSAGAPWYFISQVQDITEQRRAEMALRRSEERLAHAQAIAHLGYWDADPERRELHWSPEIFRIFGRTPGEVTFSDFFRAVHPEDRARVESALQEAFETREPFRFDHRVVRPDGTVRVVHEEGGVILHGDGLVHLVGTVLDVTEQRRAEAALSAERTWLRTLIDRSPVGILLLEEEGRKIVANRRAEELLGPIDPRAGVQQIAPRCRHPGGHPVPVSELPGIRALRGQRTISEELEIEKPDGRIAAVLISAAPIEDEEGRRLGGVVVLEDITRLKDLERLREEWTTVIAHDLRQPVTVVTAYAGLLARKIDDAAPELRGKVDHILVAARQLNRMIGDLLDVSRIEARRLSLELQPTDIATLVREVVERMQPDFPDRPVELRIAAPLPALQVDAARFEQVLANLLSNAVKYGEAGTPIVVEVARKWNEVHFSVSNEGKGIEPAELPNLFTRFHRTRGARDEKVTGLGLGLYISKGLVEAHGGRIWAESVPGKITTFRFTLPVP